VSCKITSKLELDKTIPVNPPTVKRKIKPKAHKFEGLRRPHSQAPWRVLTHLKILIPVGTAITIVAVVKYARVSVSKPTVNIWWAHTINPKSPIPLIA
jgi:hypothetical protein